MKKKHYLLFGVWTYTLLAVFLVSVAIFEIIDLTGLVLVGIMLIVLLIKSYTSFKELNITSDDEEVFSLPDNNTLAEKKRYYKRAIAVFWIAIVILSVWTIVDLNDLEAGMLEHVFVWGPVPFSYKHGGYWWAISVTPLIGILFTLLWIYRYRHLKKSQNEK